MPQVLPQNTTAFLYTQVVEGLGYIPELCWSFLEYMQCTIVACYYFALLVPNFFDVYWFQTPLETSFRRWWRRPPLAAPLSSVEIGNRLAWCHARSLRCWPLEASKNQWQFSCWIDLDPLIWIWILCFMPLLLERFFILHTDICSAPSWCNYHQGDPHEFASESLSLFVVIRARIVWK